MSLKEVSVQADVPASVRMRKIAGYAAVLTPATHTVRKVAGFAMLQSLRTIPKGKSSLELIYELINNNSKAVVFDTDTLVLGVPVAAVYQDFNSKISITTTTKTKGYFGTTFLNYNRVDIVRHFLSGNGITLSVPVNTTIYTLLPTLNQQLGSKLTTADIEDAPVLAGAARLWLVAKSTSLLYIPGSRVLIGATEPSLSSVVTVTDLPGFEPSTTLKTR
jgi:hypothetical protein